MGVPQIVTVNTSVQTAPAPSLLQQTGALLSQGGTTNSPLTLSLLTQLSDLTPLLAVAQSITGITQSGGTATAVCASPHGIPVGDSAPLTISGATQTAYDGTFICTATTASDFTYTVPSGTATPATGTITYISHSVATLTQMATTYFAQGNVNGVYVLELGTGTNEAIANLSSYLSNNVGKLYAVLTPRHWDANSNLLSLLASYESPSAKFYFYVTTTLATYSVYTTQMKCVRALIESPALGTYAANALTAIAYTSGGVPGPYSGYVTATTTSAHGVAIGQWFQLSGNSPTSYNGWFQAQTGTTGETLVFWVLSAIGSETALGTLVVNYYPNAGIGSTEFSLAANFYQWLVNNPSPTNKVAPFMWRFLYGVTPFPIAGFGSLLTTLKMANISVIGTGYQGGVSTAIDWWGTFLDGNQCGYWYSADWYQITLQLQMSNAIINGSNNPTNPTYLNQDGINTVQSVGGQVAQNGVTYGMGAGTVVLTELTAAQFTAAANAGSFAGQIVLNAIPFSSYYAGNQGQYQQGIYNGYSLTYAPLLGFESITVNLVVSTFQVA